MGLGSPVAQLMAVIGLNTAPLEAGIAKSTALLSKTGPLAMATLGAGALVAGVGVVATKMAGDFHSGLTSLVTGAGESQQNLQLVSNGIIQLAKDTGTSTKQLIDGMYMIESGGFHGANGLAILKAAAEGAKVGSADLGVVADATDTILKNFGEHGALTANQAVNALISTVAHGKTHMEDLAQALSFVLPTGQAAGLGLTDLMAAMATMTSIGVPAAESATYLRQTIVALMAPSQGAKDALASIGLTAKQVSDAMHGPDGSLYDGLKLITDHLKTKFPEGSAGYIAAVREIAGGSRQMQGILDLTGSHLQTLGDNMLTIGKATHFGKDGIEGWSLVQKGFNTQVARAREVVETLMIQLGEKLLPVATKLFSWIADNAIPALKNFKDFVTGNSVGSTAFKVALIALSGAIALNLVVAFLSWAAAAGAAAVATIAATWPILAVGAAIALLVAGIIWAYNNWGWFRKAVDASKQSIGVFLGVMGRLIERAGGLGNILKILGIILFPGAALLILIITHWKEFIAILGRVKDTVGNVLGAIGEFFGRFFGAMGSALGAFFGFIGSFVGNTIASIGHMKDAILQHILQMVVRAIATFLRMKQEATERVQELIANVVGFFTSLPGKLQKFGEQMIKALGQGIRNAAHFVHDAIKSLPIPGVAGVQQFMDSHVPHFAEGGLMASTGLAIVGEQGPETVILPGGSRVIPQSRSGGGSGISGGGSGAPIVVQLVVDGRKLAEVTAQHLPHVVRTATGNRRI